MNPVDKLMARLPELQAKARERAAKVASEGAGQPGKTDLVTQLPIWAEPLRCLPNEILRSALFSAKNRNQPREYLKKQDIAVLFDGRIQYSGESLRQDDENVWLQLIHLAKEQPLGSLVEFTPYAFCKAIGWSICKGSYERLRDSLERMQATSLSIYSTRLQEGVNLSMIPMFAWQDEEKKTLTKYRVQVAPQILELFGAEHYTRIEWEQRLALPVGLARWLHGYYASHRKPYPVKIETIKKGAGLKTEKQTKLRQIIDTALQELIKVGSLSEARIEEDLVYVKRTKRN